jgi:D-xylose transport system substrate-binding protein
MVRGARLACAAAVGALALATAACGNSSDNGSSGGGGSSAAKKVGVILPDTTTSPRWEAYDRPSLKAAFDAAGIDSDIENAGGDKTKFANYCDSMINEGVQVIMIVNLDSDSGSACLKKAAAAGIKSVDYDRLTLGGGASYYVSYDNVKVGEDMGTSLEKCLTDMGKTKANIILINGAPTDNNAALFKQGYQQALKPKVDSGTYKLVGDQTGQWDADVAGKVFEQLYTQNNGKIDGVVAANDTMAGGIVARMPSGVAGKIPVTGQDASAEGLQRVLAGTQCVSIFKDTNREAKAASDVAIALINGDTAKADSMATRTVKDSVSGQDVKSVLLDPEPIYQNNVEDVIKAGQAKASDVCTGQYAKLCTKYGVQ